MFKNSATFLTLTNMFCLLQCMVYVTLLCKTIRFINLKGTKFKIDARARIHRESVRLICLTCWLKSGFSHLMYIDSLSLTWYLCGVETKILKQPKLQEVRQDSQKPVSAYKRETIFPMTHTCARARAWKSVGLFRQCNRKICRRCAYETCQEEDPSRWISS